MCCRKSKNKKLVDYLMKQPALIAIKLDCICENDKNCGNSRDPIFQWLVIDTLVGTWISRVISTAEALGCDCERRNPYRTLSRPAAWRMSWCRQLSKARLHAYSLAIGLSWCPLSVYRCRWYRSVDRRRLRYRWTCLNCANCLVAISNYSRDSLRCCWNCCYAVRCHQSVEVLCSHFVGLLLDRFCLLCEYWPDLCPNLHQYPLSVDLQVMRWH